MTIISRYIHDNELVASNKQIENCQHMTQECFVLRSLEADIVIINTLQDYELIKHVACKKIFLLNTDDPSAANWRTMEPVYDDKFVKAIYAPTHWVLFHWNVPSRLGFVIPSPCFRSRRKLWNGVKKRAVVFGNAFVRRWWHCGSDILERISERVPVTLYGRDNYGLKNMEILPPVSGEDVLDTAADYACAFMPYRFSAAPNWLREAMTLGIPIVSNESDFARIHAPQSICKTEDECVTMIEKTIERGPQYDTEYLRSYALAAFSPERSAVALDAMIDSVANSEVIL